MFSTPELKIGLDISASQNDSGGTISMWSMGYNRKFCFLTVPSFAAQPAGEALVYRLQVPVNGRYPVAQRYSL